MGTVSLISQSRTKIGYKHNYIIYYYNDIYKDFYNDYHNDYYFIAYSCIYDCLYFKACRTYRFYYTGGAEVVLFRGPQSDRSKMA